MSDATYEVNRSKSSEHGGDGRSNKKHFNSEILMRPFFAFTTRKQKPLHNGAKPKERSDRGCFLPSGKKASSYRGAYMVPYMRRKVTRVRDYLVSLSVSVRVCVTFVVFTNWESCTTPISTHPGSMEPGKYGLMRGTCFVARCLEVVSVAGMLRISWCVFGAAGFISCFCFSSFFFFLRKHTGCFKNDDALPNIPLY